MQNKPNPIDAILNDYSVMILDGAMATELEQRGCNLDDSLWSASVLLEKPELIYEVHADYFRAGADCTITSSYQATLEGFGQKGIGEQEALELIRRTVQLAIRARDSFWQEYIGSGQVRRPKPLVAGSVGPYGAYLADGSEYVGNYRVTDDTLAAFHRPRIAALIEAGADLLAFETIPSLQEALVLERLLKETPDAYAWLSFSLKDGTSISEGTSLTECAKRFAGNPQIAAIGLNCAPMSMVTDAAQILSKHSGKPVIIYPNSGEIYDPESKSWHGGASCESMSEESQQWVDAGARIIGGCCRTTPRQIRELAKKWRG
jgi:homocysteine S-methyltransferase